MNLDGKRKLVGLAVVLALVVATEVFGANFSEAAQETMRWLYTAFAGANGLEHLGKGLAARNGDSE